MQEYFSLEGPVMGVLSKIMNFFILNICFMLGCLPVVTIGVSLSALYSVNLRMVKDEDGYIFREFWMAYKKNLKIGLQSTLLMVGIGCILMVDFFCTTVMEPAMAQFFRVILLIFCLLYLEIQIYLFSYIARFEDSLRNCIKNTVLFIFKDLKVGGSILLINLSCILLTFSLPQIFFTAAFIWLLIGFSALNFFNSKLMRKVYEGGL